MCVYLFLFHRLLDASELVQITAATSHFHRHFNMWSEISYFIKRETLVLCKNIESICHLLVSPLDASKKSLEKPRQAKSVIFTILKILLSIVIVVTNKSLMIGN